MRAYCRDKKIRSPRLLIIIPSLYPENITKENIERLFRITTCPELEIKPHNIKILTLIGGESFGKQLGSLAHHAHIVVGTPGRVLKHLNKEGLSVSDLNMLVLDEADRMLDMGFIEEIEQIKSHIKMQPQTLLFSATYDDEVLEISKKFQSNPVEITVADQEQKNDVEELFVCTQNKRETL
ncbi:MAG: DEAD/DEAH box helicase [Sulfurimonas sp.]